MTTDCDSVNPKSDCSLLGVAVDMSANSVSCAFLALLFCCSPSSQTEQTHESVKRTTDDTNYEGRSPPLFERLRVPVIYNDQFTSYDLMKRIHPAMLARHRFDVAKRMHPAMLARHRFDVAKRMHPAMLARHRFDTTKRMHPAFLSRHRIDVTKRRSTAPLSADFDMTMPLRFGKRDNDDQKRYPSNDDLDMKLPLRFGKRQYYQLPVNGNDESLAMHLGHEDEATK